jgi:hypothetical protein
MSGDPWDDWPQEPGFNVPNKVLIPVCAAIILGGGWALGWFDPIMRFIHDAMGRF